MDDRSDRLTILSNRLPVVLKRRGSKWQAEPGSGGLVQAMNPILCEDGGCWVGWPGVTMEEGEGWEGALTRVGADSGYELEPVVLSQNELERFYEGYANSVVWPLFHGFPDRCTFDPGFFEAYGGVNEKFADVVSERVDDDSFIWVHDYHLFEVARRLRQRGHVGRLAFYLHIPFPSVENFSKLPWREQLLSDLLAYDLIGFQTERDLRNFGRAVEAHDVAVVTGKDGGALHLARRGRAIEAGAFPIGIDYEDFAGRAATDEVTRKVAKLQSDIGPYQVLLGVDRLDYSKGLLQRLRAYEMALENHPDLREEVVFFQLVVPSRENVEEYAALKREFDRIVGRINGRFSTASWQPIQYLYNRVDPVELSALYRLASVGLVTPLRDGMNLVSKEYCASQVEGDGALVLSEFAGAYEQLNEGALVVNPYDTEETARAIYEAINMAPVERRRRMEQIQDILRRTDVFWWAQQFLLRARAVGRRPDGVIGLETAGRTAG